MCICRPLSGLKEEVLTNEQQRNGVPTALGRGAGRECLSRKTKPKMKTGTILLPLITYATSVLLVTTAATQPANDFCSNAVVIASANYTNSQATIDATSDGDPAAPCGSLAAGVWYQYTPPTAGDLVLDTAGSDFDTVLALYSGSCGALTPLACNDDGGTDLTSAIVCPVVGGTSYYILAGGFDGSTGDLVFHLTFVPPGTPPRITAQTLTNSVMVGDFLFLSVTALGSSPLSYSWSFNGTNLPGSTNSTFFLEMETNCAGNYLAVVSNAFGAATSSVMVVRVAQPPFILSDPTNQYVLPGDTASFSVEAIGLGPLTYQWRFNSTNLLGATASSLTITNIQLGNLGYYQVAVTGTNGDQALSYPARLQFVTAPQLSLQPASLTAPAGFKARFRAIASGGPLNFQWQLNGTNLVDGNDFRDVFTPELTVVSAQPSTAGGYQLLVTNLAGSATSAVATLTVAQIPAELPGVRLTTLASFVDPYENSPASHLVVGSDGMLYGTTRYSGTNQAGTLFRVPPSGILETIYNFGSVQDPSGIPLDGAMPVGQLALGIDGNVYGTTGFFGYGTAFRVTTNGILTTVASFYGDTTGGQPTGLVRGADGNFYGTTRAGGANDGGTFFRLTTNGTLTVLASFPDRHGQPNGGLAEGAAGHFYGTTSQGGPNHCGTVFEATSNAVTTLYSFGAVRDENGNALDGAYLYGGLVLGADGNLYGATAGGGSEGWGTVFRTTPAGNLTTLVSFNGMNGAEPNAQLLAASDGKLYGTTAIGGISYVDDNLNYGFGTVFQLTTNGVLTTLVSFNGNTTGGEQDKELLQTSDGTFYGTTEAGGAGNCGTLFRLTVTTNAAPAPVFQSVQKQAGTVTFSWSAVVGRNYQAQFKTNLTQADWSNLGLPLQATNSTASAFDRTTANPQRFYRVVLLP
jgi:uncharacterized repeat protein (TIGR03803 family)